VEKVVRHKDTNRIMFFVNKTELLDKIIQKWKNDIQYHKIAESMKEVRRMMRI